jgi:uncharacterized protein (DUF697 family)
MGFWDVIKEVSAQAVRKEAARLFVLALAGDPEAVAAARARVLGPNPTPEELEQAETYLFTASPPYSEEDEKKLRYADLLISLPGGPGVTEFRPADTLLVENPESVVLQALAHRPDLRVGLGRRLPGFRNLAAEYVIRDVSRVNAEYAAIAGITQSIPFLAPIFPAVAGTDVLILTKNQVIMMFRLAGIYGEDLDLKSRVREVVPVIGSGLGWRALARQIVGWVPGFGIPARAAIAYAGTYAAGRAAQMVFDEGRRPTRGEMRRIYEEASHLAKGIAANVRERVRRKELPPPAGALPEPQQEPVELDEEAPEPAARERFS